MRKITKLAFAASLAIFFSATAAAAGVISINVTGEGGDVGAAVEAAFANGEAECTGYFGGIATAYQVVSTAQYPGFWWAEINVSCSIP